MEWQIVVVLVIVAPLILFPAAFIWYVNIGGFYQTLKERRAKARATAEEKRAEVVEGQLAPEVVTVAARAQRRPRPRGRTAKRIRWAAILTLGLPIAVALIPLFPALFIWYVNISGLYQVQRDSRQRRKARARGLRRATGVASGKVIPNAAGTGT